MQKVTFFDTREELAELTGLSMENHCDELWKAGYCLEWKVIVLDMNM